MIHDDKIELSVNATLKIPADHWSPSNRGVEIQKLADALAQLGEIGRVRIEPRNSALSLRLVSQLPTLHPPSTLRSATEDGQYGYGARGNPQPRCGPSNRCAVCGWIHDAAFTQINTGQTGNLTIGGRLPDIVALVHRAHEQGLAGVGTKDAELQKTCGGYHHPAKAFYDLKHRHDYKILFDTHKRGFLSLRGALVITRNNS